MIAVLRSSAILVLTCATLSAMPQPPVQGRDPRSAGQQPPPTGTASISGAVTMASTGQPARKVRVSVSGVEIRGNRTATTDDQGRFSFTALPAGRYTLSASRPGHVTVTYGQRQPGRPGTAIQLTDGQKFVADLQIPKGGVITGTVLDENGEPTPQTPVRVMRVLTANGGRRLQGTSSGSTDDRGIYRVFGLLPGEYVVCATPRNTATTDLDRMRAELQGLEQALQSIAQSNQDQARSIRDRILSIRSTMSVATDEGPPPGYAPICYPGSISTSTAAPVPLGVGEERMGIDFQLQLAPLARVEGSVINSTGAQVRSMNVTLNELNPLGPAMPSISARADGEGRFRLNNVPPGQYRLSVRATAQTRTPQQGPAQPAGRGGPAGGRTDTMTVWASTDIAVDGRNLSNVMLTLQPGISVTGQIAFDGAIPPPADLSRLRVTMSSAEPGMPGGSSSGRVEANGRFTVPNVVPGRYRLTAGGASGWFVESAVIGGQDALDFPIEIKGNENVGGAVITFSDRQTELTGVVTDENNQPAVAYTLVVFPSDERYWSSNRRVQSVRPATDGRYTVRGLPPGDYRIAPVVDLEPGATTDPNFLQQLEASSLQVTLQRGENKVQDMQLR